MLIIKNVVLKACNKGFQSKAIKFEVFAEQWFEEYAKPNLRNTTYERMLQLRKRVYSAIGHMRMDKITLRQIQAFVNSLSKEGANERTGKPLAPKTIRHNLSFVSDVFSYAVKMEMLTDNPCKRVTVPKGEKKELLDVGKVFVKDSCGNEIPMYNIERTICDLVQSRNTIDIQEFLPALKAYVKRKDKDMNKLFEYSKLFRIQNVVRKYMQVLL